MQDRHRDVGSLQLQPGEGAGGLETDQSRAGALVRALAAADHVDPDGCAMRVGRSTLDEWISTGSN